MFYSLISDIYIQICDNINYICSLSFLINLIPTFLVNLYQENMQTYTIDMSNDLVKCSSKELEIRERFKSDYKISCPVLDDKDCFYKSLELFNVRKKWDEYFSMALRYDNFDEHRNNIRHNIVKTISSVSGFNELKEDDIDIKYGPYKSYNSYLRKELSGCRLISLDLIKGNFQSLRYLDEKYVLNCETYEELISKFTDDRPLINSKMFRQIVFGLLNPKIQFKIQRKIIYHLIHDVLEKYPGKSIEHLTSDEVVFKVDNDQEANDIKLITEQLCKTYKYKIKITEFSIKYINNDYNADWFIKTNKGTDDYKITGVHIRYLFQLFNWLNKIENKKKDFWWRERGKLCSLLEPETFSF